MNSPLAPFRIFIAGQELLGWTSATLSRKKADLTGTLSVAVFFTYMPRTPMMRFVVEDAEVLVYVGGHLAFTGKVDKRKGGGKGGGKGSGAKTAGAGKAKSIGSGHHTAGGGVSTSITPENYVITIRCTGKTAPLVKSSHLHKTSMKLGAKLHDTVQELIEPFEIEPEFIAPDNDLDKAGFRDGAMVDDEVQRFASESGVDAYETRDGKLRLADGPSGVSGEPLILGDNILSFSAEQSAEPRNTDIKVKGQRTKKGIRGRDAVNREKTVQVQGGGGSRVKRPLNLNLESDATDQSLERRARHEADRQNQEGKQVRVDVFHVQSRDGSPWDIGTTHYVEIPTEGIFDEMECVELTYTVDHDKHLKTQLVLSPLPGGSNGAGGMGQLVQLVTGGAGMAGLPGGIASILNGSAPGLDRLGGPEAVARIVSGVAQGLFSALPQTEAQIRGALRRAQLGIMYEKDAYPVSWGRTSVEVVHPDPNALDPFGVITDAAREIATAGFKSPPLKLTS